MTVKASPAVSRKHGEVVCVAGVRTDGDRHRWARLFPVHFRDLAFTHRFKKYQRISLEAVRPRNDRRPESLQPVTDSLALGTVVDTGRDRSWAERRAFLEPLMVESMCEVQRRQAADRTSLGLFRPQEVQDFIAEPAAEWGSRQQAIVAQPSLFSPTRTTLEKIPYRFLYRYTCADMGCRGHEQSIVDWELSQAYRSFRDRYGEQEVVDRLRQRWLGELCGPARDTAFFVGNQHQHPDSFLVLGVFWPPQR